jgi:(1->4)-alpha-D-glucan 1-alpha-D-glucosylmutase
LADLRATYRLQLTDEFGFAAARALIPYLRRLGVSHLYLSPVWQARPGSTHGYDVIDPARISEALGGAGGFRALSAAAREAGLGVVLDVVPNHMAAAPENRHWADPELRARFFDVDPETGRHRRFFDIDELAGVRQEDEGVFEETHRLVLSLLREGLVDGVRIDHPDGLADPAGYLARLRERAPEGAHVWVEKILTPAERLRDWPVSGTVGYEFLNDVCALFVDPDAEAELTSVWKTVSGDRRAFGEVALECKLEQLRSTFRPELERLSRGFDASEGLERALASLPVYRTYVEPWSGLVTDEDRSVIAAAGIDDALAQMLLLERGAPAGFVTRFQQTTPAVMAKGVEDTALYRYVRLLALNDVGSDPSRFGISVERFHAANAERAQRFPLSLLATQTHDAKRSADVRARIGALTTMPGEWATHVERWLSIAEPLRGDQGAGAGAPDAVEQYFLFQTLVGAWPIEIDRLEAYMEKALREAKRNTSWVDPNPEWEASVKRFCRALVADRAFLDDFEPFAARVAAVGEQAALGQLALKLTAPGVPDIYQGDELPYRALVDPDNRRPVDWDGRRTLLARVIANPVEPDAATRKLWLTWRLLGLRARRHEAFQGGYRPLAAGEHTCAYLRGDDVLVAVHTRPGRPPAELEEPLPRGSWRRVVDLDGIVVAERIGGAGR